MFLVDWFTLLIYQPFLNILVFFYWLLGLVTNGQPDMGVAVILLTVLIRVLLLPLSLAGHRSEADRRQISAKVKAAEIEYAADPIRQKKAVRKILQQSKPVIIAEIFTLTIQVMIALMLWKIFDTGLTGQDLHLIYSFMPSIEQPFNLKFLGDFDLTHTSFRLNLIQAILIFVLETIATYTSLYPVSRHEVVRLQLVLPVVAFIIFMALPSGKKLFVITSLLFSIALLSYRAIQRRFFEYKEKVESAESNPNPPEEKVVVEVK
jgi:membrane protein insertase Oxa1/YidC/SpoIIIJ